MTAPPILCSVESCPRAHTASAPFLTLAARGSHLRRVHGIHSLAQLSKRPPGGEIRCPHPECAELQPYLSLSGRATHLRTVHHAGLSTKPDSVRKRISRRSTRAIAELTAIVPSNPNPPPNTTATVTHVSKNAGLTPGQEEYLRLRLLYVVNGSWAREIDAPPIAIRDAIEQICRRNFAPAPRRRPVGREE